MNSFLNQQSHINVEMMEKREMIKEDILYFYGERLPDILEVLYNEAHFEKQIQHLEPIFESPFHYRFIEIYGLNLFVDGFMFSLYSNANMLNEMLKKDISKEIIDRLDSMARDAQNFFDEKEVECFTLTSYKIFEFGMQAGKEYSL